MLTSNEIKQKAKAFGADLCGIGDISLFAGTDPRRDPLRICPKARCVIGFGFRVPRGLYYGMEQAGQFLNYTALGVKYIDEELSEMFLLRMAGVIENEGYDACVQRNVSNLRIKGDKTQNPEVIDTYELLSEPVSPDKPEPDVILDFTQAARICGLGSSGLRGNLLIRAFGPYVRTVFIVTDMPLDCDPPFAGELCDRCGLCVNACPGHAIALDGFDSWQCSVYYRGAHRSNPYITEAFLRDDPRREQILNGDFRFDAGSARAIYPSLDFLPSNTTGYAPCICGKRCDIACYHHLMEGKNNG